MIDVDYFKTYNDLYGHLAGDRCLQLIASTMTRQLRRPSDQLTRFGGEEFACILPETDPAGAHKIAQMLKASIGNLQIVHAQGIEHRVSVSIGVASGYPHAGCSSDKLLLLADQCLYQAKMDGRNSICADDDSTRLNPPPG
jgi:diguanylate cyclase (GGDEF)-like protein